MKKFLLIFTVILSVTGIKAQDTNPKEHEYIPLIKPGIQRWYVERFDKVFGYYELDSNNDTTLYVFNRTVDVDGKEYDDIIQIKSYKLYYINAKGEKSFQLLISEDIKKQEIFYLDHVRDTMYAKWHLWYFYANIGDCMYCDEYVDYRVTDIDTIYIANAFRKMITVSYIRKVSKKRKSSYFLQ